MKLPVWLPAALVAAALLTFVAATRRDLAQPHLRLFTEMVKSPAPKAQSGRTPSSPPPGTRPRGAAASLTVSSEEEAGRALKNPVPASLAALDAGRRLYESTCAHCHGLKGRGDGAVTKSVPAFSFSVAGKSTYDLPDGQLFWVIGNGRNQMPPHSLQLSQEQRWTVVHYLRDLQRREQERLGPMAELPEDPRRSHLVDAAYGKELYGQNCGSCHGPEGRAPLPGVPTLNLPSVLAYADDDYYFGIITHGRRGTQMPAWDKALTRTQILSVVKFLRGWAAPAPDRSSVLAKAGDPTRGGSIFRGRCAGCHGRKGAGGVGNTLNSPSFLALASPQFFRDMVIGGRRHTAMPASYDLSTEEVGDLVAHMRSWAKPRHSFEATRALLPAASKDAGAKLFAGRCAGCHAGRGENGIGSRLDSDSFLRMADDRFLFRAVSEGRPGTAMPAWYFLSDRDMADLLVYIRSWQRGPSEVLPSAPRRGDPDFGKLVYDKACAACHGPEGRGGAGGQIGNPVFLSSASDEFLWRTIAAGKDGSPMRGFLRGRSSGPLMTLSESDIDHVVAYLRSLQDKPRVDPLARDFPGASAEAGREVYLSKGGCAKCHGQDGEGASGPSLNSTGFLKAASNGYLAATIILGRDGTEMRSFGRSGNVNLSPKDVMDVVAYIRTWETAPPRVTRVVDRSASSASEGRLLFDKYCAGCHGGKGEGAKSASIKGYAPSLNTPEFLRAADDSFLMATIAVGRPNTAMRPFGVGVGGVADLSAAEIRKIVAYMRSWEVQK